VLVGRADLLDDQGRLSGVDVQDGAGHAPGLATVDGRGRILALADVGEGESVLSVREHPLAKVPGSHHGARLERAREPGDE